MRKLLFLIAALIIFVDLRAQTTDSYDWNEIPQVELTEDEKLLPELILQFHQVYDYIYESEEKNLVLYKTLHQKVLANNAASIEKHNKIYISMNDVLEIKELKARTISPDGKIVELDKSNIKELKDEEGQGYQIFAIEGAQEGGIIEYYYTLKLQPSLFGRIISQFSSPVKSASLSFYMPENLFFAFKSYNNFPEMEKMEKGKDQEYNYYFVSAQDIPALFNEAFSSHVNNKMRVEYKLNYNRLQGSKKVYSWANAATSIYNSIYNLQKSESRALDKIFKTIDLSAAPDERAKIFAIEDVVKSNYYIQDSYDAQLSQLDFIQKNKFANKRGIARLMANLYKTAGINHELIITTGRDGVKFDKDFETYAFLNEYLIYFPGEQLYISPSSMELRYGLIPASLMATYGLHIKNVKLTDFTFPVGDIKYIPAQDYTHNYDNLTIDVDFDADFNHILVNLQRDFYGYSAAYQRIAFMYLEDDKKKAAQQDLVKYIAQDAAIEELTFENTAVNLENADKPLVLKTTFTSASFIERAGNDIIFNIGKIIGQQSELYQENERTTDVENDFNRGYLRKISVNIPEGYKISNPDDLNLDFKVEEEGKIIYKFVSEYEIKGNVLQIEIDEFYDRIYYPAEKFEAFRSVINAAADFNKISLILQKL